MNNFNNLLKQAQQMQAKLMEAQNKLDEIEIVGSSGGGMVTVTLNGKREMKKLSIDSKLMSPDEVDIVCDLIVAAYNDAKNKMDAEMAKEMGGLMPAGIKLPF